MPRSRSRASSSGSKPGSSIYGSVPSVDLVSPAAFMFSGPSLRSMPSFSNSRSRFPSLAGSGSEIQPLSRARTDSFSMLDDASILGEGILEPIDEGGIMRTMSDVLLGNSIPMEDVMTPFLDGPEQDGSLMHPRDSSFDVLRNASSLNAITKQTHAHCAASKIVALLLPHLNFDA